MFQSEWSAPHEAVSIKDVIIILKEINSNRNIVVHHDRILSGINISSRELELTSNFQGDEQDPEWGTLLVKQPKTPLMRTSQGPLIKSTKQKDFEYNFILPSYNVFSPSISSSLDIHLQSTPLTSKALEAHLLLFPSTPSYTFNPLYSSCRSLCTSSAPLQCD